MLAAQTGQGECLDILLRAKADVLAQDILVRVSLCCWARSLFSRIDRLLQQWTTMLPLCASGKNSSVSGLPC